MAHKKQRTLTQHIPNDLISDILLGLPVKSLMRFRCVCKSWNYLITSSRFISMHLHHATKDSYRSCNKLILASGKSLLSLDYEAPTANVEQLDFPLEAPRGFEVVGSCNGLLCIAIHYGAIIVLWNPSIRKYKEIQFTLSSRKFPDLYGFGYDSTIEDYKFVKVNCESRKLADRQIEFYKLKNNSWTTVENKPPLALAQLSQTGTHVNGALYWSVFDGNHQKIFRFDLRDDTCILIQLPRDVETYRFSNFKLRDFGGSLCMFERDYGYSIKLWILKESSYERSWVKLTTIPRLEEMPFRGYLVPVCSTKNGEILLESKECRGYNEEKEKFYLYTSKETGKFRELENCRIEFWYSIAVTFVESLVSPDSDGVQSFSVREEEKNVASIAE